MFDEDRKLALGAGAYAVMSLLGVILYVWSIGIALSAVGIIAAVATALLPPFAQIYWGIALWTSVGAPSHPYCVALLVCAGMLIAFFIAFALAA
jgi:hypothetical protein